MKGSRPFDRKAADALADEVAVLVRRGVIDQRSRAADALLDYRDPPFSDRSERIAAELAKAPQPTCPTCGHTPFAPAPPEREKALAEIEAAVTLLEAPRNAEQYGVIHDVIRAARRGVLLAYLDSRDGDLDRILAGRAPTDAPAQTAWTCPDCCVRPCICLKRDKALAEGEKDREAMERQHDSQKLPGRFR